MGTCGRVVLGDVSKDSEKCAKNSQNGSVADGEEWRRQSTHR